MLIRLQNLLTFCEMRLLHVLSPKIDEYREECVRATENEGIFEVNSFFSIHHDLLFRYQSTWEDFQGL